MGTLRKNSTGALRFPSVAFNQQGVLDFAAGTLVLSGGGENTSSIQVPAGGQLLFSGSYGHPAGSVLTGPGEVVFQNGTHTLAGTYTVGGPTTVSGGVVNFAADASLGELRLTGGEVGGSGRLEVTELLSWTQGTMRGDGKLVLGAAAVGEWTGAADKWLNRPMDNLGVVNWSGGRFLLQQATFNNLGEMTVSHEADVLGVGGTVAFNNVGTLRKNSTGALRFPSVPLRSTGTITGVGTISVFDGGLTQEGVLDVGIPLGRPSFRRQLPLSTLSTLNLTLGGTVAGIDYDQLVVPGAISLRGALNITLAEGYLPLAGTEFEIVQYGSREGFFDQITGLNLGEELFLEPTFGVSNLVLTVVDTRQRPVFGAATRIPGGEVLFRVGNVAGQNIVVEASPELEQPEWVPVWTNLNSGAVFEFMDPEAMTLPRRFFRTRLLP